MGTATRERIEELESRVKSLSADVQLMKNLLDADSEEKDYRAWERLESLGEEIGQNWKSKKASWLIISEGRR